MRKILSRYLLVEVLRVLLLSTGVLVAVIAFGAAIRPLAEELLSPAETIKYVGFATIPMLQYALPFAAGFAATIVVSRLSSDNEILAMSTAGLSYRRILRPLGMLGIVLAVIMLVLSHAVIPRFWSLMKHTIVKDATRVFASTLRGGNPFIMDEWQIYADAVDEVPGPEDTGATTRLILNGVVAMQVDDEGVLREVTGQYAVIDVHRRESMAFLKLVIVNTTVFEPREGSLVSLPEVSPRRPPVIPDPVRSDTKFMTSAHLRRLAQDPDLYPGVVRRRRPLVTALDEARHWRLAERSLAETGVLRLVHPESERSWEIEADRLNGANLRRDGTPIRLMESVRHSADRETEASAVSLRLGSAAVDGSVTFQLEVHPTRITNLRTGRLVETTRTQTVSGLRLVDAGEGPYGEMASPELLSMVADLELPSQGPLAPVAHRVRRGAEILADELLDVRAEVVARLNQRTALSLSAPLLLLLGATMAIWLWRTMPLTIYLWAFAPSITAIMLISSGEQLIKDQAFGVGIVTMWAGDALLAALVLWVYRRLARN
jgi:hypothetical protein